MSSFEGHSSTLAEIEEIRRRTRTSLHSVWYPLVVWGAAMVGAAAVAGIGGIVFGVYWLAAIVVCNVVVGRYYERRARRLGIGDLGSARRYARLWVVFLPALLVAGAGAAALGGTPAALAAEAAVLGAAYLVIARWEESVVMAVLAAAVVALGAGIAALDPAHLVAISNLVLGAALLLAGFYALSREESP